MNLNPVILAIPMYFLLMGIELIYEKISNRKTYRLNDAITNISTGTLQQLTNTFVAIIRIGIYTFIYEQWALFKLEQNWVTFIVAMILFDFFYYWEHRMAHTISLFWGGHVVHHQSEDFNLSVALRQTSTGFIWGFPFYLPMALMGFHPVQFVLVGGLNLLYQFWIHTEHINKLPRWFEFVFNTPSHHRVHHGRDPKYIDKNYAGVLIIWDRIFGTFTKEEERPNYGITKPLKSWNPVYANFAHYIDLFKTTKKSRSLGDTLKILFKRPGWFPEYLGGYQAPFEVADDYKKYNKNINLGINTYLLIQFIVALTTYAAYFFKNTDMEPIVKIAFASWIIITTLMFGFLFESRNNWVKLLEIFRLVMIPIGTYFLQRNGLDISQWLLLSFSIFAIGSIIAFLIISSKSQISVKDIA